MKTRHNDQHTVYGDTVLSAAEMIAEHTGRIEWAEFHATADVAVRSAILETATRQREGL